MGRATLRTSCLALLFLAALVHGAAAQAADDETLHQAWLADEELQTARPVDAPEPEPERRPIGFFVWLARMIGSLGPVFEVIFYVGVAAVVFAALWFILDRFAEIRFGGTGKPARAGDDVLPAAGPDAAAARSLLGEADALALDGRFSEAVHLLLFRSIDDIQSRRNQRLPTALTAREIGSLKDLPGGPRAALQPIISLVERSFFGGRPLGPADWTAARASYERFAFGEAWA